MDMPAASATPATPRPDRLLLPLVAVAGVFDQYDTILLSLLLPHVQRDLGIPDAFLGPLGGLVRGASLLAPFCLLALRRLGVRQALLWTVGGFSISTAVAGGAVTVFEFAAAQLVTRVLVAVEGLLTMVLLVDAYPVDGRGRRVGLIGALGTIGTVVAYLAYPYLISTPLGWRGMYFLGVVPAIAVFVLRRRWLSHVVEPSQASKARSPERTERARRMIIVAVILGTWAASLSPALFFVPKYLHDEAGWDPKRIGLIVATVTLLSAPATLVGGWLSDRIGRRPILLAMFALGPLSAGALFASSSDVAVGAAGLAMGWSLGIVNALGIMYGAEIGGQGSRTTSTAIVGGAWIGGGAAGLVLEGLLFTWSGSHHAALLWLMTLGVAATFAAFAFSWRTTLFGRAD